MASSPSASNRGPGISDFADSTYYPPGWDRERIVSAASFDFVHIPRDERDKLRAGMIEKMGAESYYRWMDLKAKATALKLSKYRYLIDQMPWGHMGSREVWGFVVFKTAGYDLAPEQWEDIKRRVEKGILAPLELYLHNEELTYPDHRRRLQDARVRFRLVWVENEQLLKGCEPRYVAETFGSSVERGIVPATLNRARCCLCVDDKALKSLQISSTSAGQEMEELGRIQLVGPMFKPKTRGWPQGEPLNNDVVCGHVSLGFILAEWGLFHLVARGISGLECSLIRGKERS